MSALASTATSLALADAMLDRQVNELCFELLNAEAVALYLDALDAPAVGTAAAATAKTSDPPPVPAKDGGAALDLSTAFTRLEAIGYQVGVRLTERHASTQQRFADAMECVKFICRDLWTLMFKKQADNLKTNHKGTFVLQDMTFRWFLRMSPPARMPPQEALARARLYAALPCGVVRGALASMGLNATVTVEVPALPQCAFKINLVK